MIRFPEFEGDISKEMFEVCKPFNRSLKFKDSASVEVEVEAAHGNKKIAYNDNFHALQVVMMKSLQRRPSCQHILSRDMIPLPPTQLSDIRSCFSPVW